MASNHLKINPVKPEFLWCTTARRLHHVSNSSFQLADGDVIPTSYVQNLGANFDVSMCMAIHVIHLVRTCFYQLHGMRAIRRLIPMSTAIQLKTSFVISRIDYCNNLLAGLPEYQSDRVQFILNFAAHLIYERANYDHVTPILWDKRHWLRIPQRIQYKCCLLVYKALHGLSPGYISNFCTRVRLSYCSSSLRSATMNHNKLVVPRSSKFHDFQSISLELSPGPRRVSPIF